MDRNFGPSLTRALKSAYRRGRIESRRSGGLPAAVSQPPPQAQSRSLGSVLTGPVSLRRILAADRRTSLRSKDLMKQPTFHHDSATAPKVEGGRWKVEGWNLPGILTPRRAH